MEFIDYLLVFFASLTAATVILGNIYGRYFEPQLRREVGSNERGNLEREERRGDSELSHETSNATPRDSNETQWQTRDGFSAIYARPAARPIADFRPYQDTSASSTAPQMSSSGAKIEPQSDQKLDSSQPSIPVAIGANDCCVTWVNDILSLIFTQNERYSSIFGDSLVSALNEKLNCITNASPDYCDLIVEFTGIRRELSSRPLLDDVRVESELEKDIKIIFSCFYEKLVLDLVVQRAPMASQISEQNQLELQAKTHYELSIENLDGRLESIISLDSKLIVTAFIEKPDFKIMINWMDFVQQVGRLSGFLSEDALVTMLTQSIRQILIVYYFGNDAEFPHHKAQTSKYMEKLNLIRDGASQITRQLRQKMSPKERKALIKIIRAQNINYNQNVTCLMELDHSTPRLQLTSTKSGSNPFWDENFIFLLGEKSNELNIELWDSITRPEASEGNGRRGQGSLAAVSGAKQPKLVRSNLTQTSKLLGSAKVSVDQMRSIPMQKISLKLISAPLESSELKSQHVDFGQTMEAGELLVDLTYMEHSSDFHRSPSANSLSGSHASKGLVQSDSNSLVRAVSPSQSSASSQLNREPDSASQRPGTGDSGLTEPTNEDSNKGAELRRSRSRSRNFLQAIKRRFSFSHRRSRSASGSGIRANTETPDGSGMSRGPEGASLASFDMHKSGAKSMPNSREPSEVPTIVINRSALDGPDALSFNVAKSRLVFECLELVPSESEPSSEIEPESGAKELRREQETVTKYYAIEDESLARKWRNKGLKLHLFNEHQFVACHLSGSPTCHNCGRVFSRRPGKQGYRCRNCHLLSHKECHVKVDHQCPYAPPDGLKLELMSEEPPRLQSGGLFRSNSLRILNWNQRQQSRQLDKSDRRSKSNPKLSSKSVSLEADER